MKKTFTFYIFLLCIAFCQAQGPKFAAYQKKVLELYCSCLQTDTTLSANIILNDKTETCLRKIIMDNADALLDLSDEFTFNENMSDYEKGRHIGKLVISDGIDELVAQCPFYVTTMKRYFKEESKAKGLTAEEIDTALVEFKKIEPTMETDVQRYLLSQILAMVYYLKSDFSESLKYFERANAMKSTTFLKGFIEMIKQYELKEKH